MSKREIVELQLRSTEHVRKIFTQMIWEETREPQKINFIKYHEEGLQRIRADALETLNNENH